MPHKRSLKGQLNQVYRAESLEYSKARWFCFQNSERDTEMQETIFTGTPEDLELCVDATVLDADLDAVPDCPRGLVISDNHACGAFDTVKPKVYSIEDFQEMQRVEAYDSKGAL